MALEAIDTFLLTNKEQLNIDFNEYPEGDYAYTRISKDEDNKKDAIETQINLINEHANTHKIKIERTFQDNDVSGYVFDRPDFNILKELIYKQKVKRLFVKDFSRIGRNNGLTQIFLAFCKKYDTKVISITENMDSSDENDDMIIGVKTWYNELYVKDLSKKIRTNIRQKQKEGLVIVPQFGYMKDPNDSKKVIIDEEVAWIVQEIFRLYTQEGLGIRKIADLFNEANKEKMVYITPALHKRERFSRKNHRVNSGFEHLWYETSIKRIITNDVYIGTLRCGITQRTMIKGGRKQTSPDQHIIHKEFLPAIVSEETYDLAQLILKQRKQNNVRAGNDRIHRYAGLLQCGDCHKVFVARKKTGANNYLSYVCSTYHRYGKGYCSTHRIQEKELDLIIYEHLESLLDAARNNLKNIDKFINDYQNKKKNYVNTIDKLQIQIAQAKEEIKDYSRQLAKKLIDEETFKELTKESQKIKEGLEIKLSKLSEMQDVNEKSKTGVIKSTEVLEEMVKQKKISDTGLRLLIDKIIIKEDNSELDVKVYWNAPFSFHMITPPCGDVISWLSNF